MANDRRLTRFVAFVVTVVLVIVLVTAYQVQSRNRTLAELRQITAETEQLVEDATASRDAPESVAYRQRILRGLDDIAAIKQIICAQTPAPECETERTS